MHGAQARRGIHDAGAGGWNRSGNGHAARARSTCQGASDRLRQFEIYESPFAAIVAGEETNDDALFRDSLEDFDRKADRATEFLRRLEDISLDALGPQDRATYGLMQREPHKIRDFHEVKAHMRPSLFPAGPDFNLRFFANGATAHTIADADRYLRRLGSIPGYIEDLRGCLKAGLEEGFRYPAFVLEKTVAAIRAGYPDSVDASPLLGPFHKSLLAESPKLKALAEKARQLVEDEILPAQSGFADFLANDLMQRGRESIACSDDPAGD